jgi:hypothetical protein
MNLIPFTAELNDTDLSAVQPTGRNNDDDDDDDDDDNNNNNMVRENCN